MFFWHPLPRDNACAQLPAKLEVCLTWIALVQLVVQNMHSGMHHPWSKSPTCGVGRNAGRRSSGGSSINYPPDVSRSNRVAPRQGSVEGKMRRTSHGNPMEIHKKICLGRPHGKSICPSCHGVWDHSAPVLALCFGKG